MILVVDNLPLGPLVCFAVLRVLSLDLSALGWNRARKRINFGMLQNGFGFGDALKAVEVWNSPACAERFYVKWA